MACSKKWCTILLSQCYTLPKVVIPLEGNLTPGHNLDSADSDFDSTALIAT